MATGSLSEALDVLHTALSKSSTLQAEVATSSEDVLKQKHILLYQDTDVADLKGLGAERPVIILGIESQRWDQVGAGPIVRAGTIIAMRFYWNNDDLQGSDSDEYIACCDFIGQVMDDLTDELGATTTADYGSLNIEMVEPIERTDLGMRVPEQQDVWTCKYIVDTTAGG